MLESNLGLVRWNHWLFFKDRASALHGPESDDLFMLIWWISVFFFVLLMGLMIYFSLKYRRRASQVAPPSASHNTPLEIAWTVIPLGILAVIFFKGFHGYMAHTVVPAGAIDVDLQAQKWDWVVTYPGGEQSPEKLVVGDKAAPVFVFPYGTPVRMRMHSIDVIHSFWVPDFRGKFDVMPNRYTVYWFNADKPSGPTVQKATLKDGTEYEYQDHWAFCAEYCGDSHSEMTGVIRIVPPHIYPRIIEMWGTSGMTPVQRGQRVHAIKCSSCHSTDGKPGTGPTWLDLFGRTEELADGSSVLVDENYVRESILEPGKRITKGFGNVMTPFQGLIKEEEIAGIIAFMKSISQHAPAAPADGGVAPGGAGQDEKQSEPPGDGKQPAPAAPDTKGSGK